MLSPATARKTPDPVPDVRTVKICVECFADGDADGPRCSRCPSPTVPHDSPRGQELLNQRQVAVREGLMPVAGLFSRTCERCGYVAVPKLVKHSVAVQVGPWGLSALAVGVFFVAGQLAVWLIIAAIWLFVKQRGGVLRCRGCGQRVGAPVPKAVTPESPRQRTARVRRIVFWTLGGIALAVIPAGLIMGKIDEKDRRASSPRARAAWVEESNRHLARIGARLEVEGRSNEVLRVYSRDCRAGWVTWLGQSRFLADVRTRGFEEIACIGPHGAIRTRVSQTPAPAAPR